MNVYPTPNGDVELGDYPARMDKDWVNIVWIITSQCNLGCSYCIGFKSDGIARSLIDRFGTDKIVERFEQVREKTGKQLYITMTGGEPTITKDFAYLCGKLTGKKFVIELQSNLISSFVKEFVDIVDPEFVSQITASYHGWALDKDDQLRARYMDNFHYAMNWGITCVLKTIVLPDEVNGIVDKISC